MPERREPPTWVTDGEREWIGRLAQWTPWEPPPRVIAVLCADCEHPAAPGVPSPGPSAAV